MTYFNSTKTTLRRVFIKRRRHYFQYKKSRTLEENLLKRFIAEVSLEKHKVIAGYIPHKCEFNVLPMMTWCYQQGLCVAIPYVCLKTRIMTFYPWVPGAPMHVDDLGFLSADTQKSPQVFPTLILTPLVAFDKRGTRLGQGGGYYDRYFNEQSRQSHFFYALGMAYEVQHTSYLKPQGHDYPLDACFTDLKMHTFDERKRHASSICR